LKTSIPHIISVLLHPLLIPLYTLIFIFSTISGTIYLTLVNQIVITIILIVTTILFPVGLMPLLKVFRFIKSYQLENNRERILPLFITFFGYYFCYLVLSKPVFSAPQIFLFFILLTCTTLLFIIMISIWWKISTHLVAMGGLLAFTIFVSYAYALQFQYILPVVAFIAGASATSRLQLESHSPAQIYTGFLFGFIIMFLGLNFIYHNYLFFN